MNNFLRVISMIALLQWPLACASAQDYFLPLGNQSFEGKITDIIHDEHMVIVQYNVDTDGDFAPDDYENVNCYVSSVTQLTKNGRAIGIDDLREGERVHVDITVDEDGHRVTSVIAVVPQEK